MDQHSLILNFSSLQELKNLIPKSAVGTLSANSSNVINLIIDAYNVSTLKITCEKRLNYTNGPHKKKINMATSKL